MRINDVGLGANQPIRKPMYAMQLGDAFVEGSGPIVFARGAGFADMPVKVWVKSPVAIAGYAAGTQGANEALVRWLEELSRNPELQSVYVRWSDSRALPQDGWWFFVDCRPDYTFSASGAIPVDMTFRQRSQAGAPVRTSWGGGAMKSVYTGAAVNLLGLPQGIVGAATAVRTGAEGSYPFVLNPPGPGSVDYLPSSTPDDSFKAGCKVFDALGGLSTNVVPQSSLTGNVQTVFTSIGTAPADGTLNAWLPAVSGVPTIASNIVTLPANARIVAGHQDWGDGTFTQRFRWTTGTGVEFFYHFVDTSNYIKLYLDGSNIYLQRTQGGGPVTLVQVVAALTTATQYWVRVSSSGTTYTISIYSDSAGTIGAMFATVSGVIPDAILQVGKIGLGSVTNSTQFGGAFAGVCTMATPTPAGFTPNAGTGEPAWCWSAVRSFSGQRSLSIYNNHSSAQAWWNGPNMALLAATPYTASCQAWGLTGSAPSNFYANINFGGGAPNVVCDSAWHVSSVVQTPGAGNFPVELIAYGTGLYYFDVELVTSPTGPVQANDFEAGLFVNSNWLEARNTDHAFAGDVVLTNGLLMLTVTINGSVQLWGWNPATTNWSLAGTINSYDPISNLQVPIAVRITKVSAEEVAADVTYLGAANSLLFSFRIQRAQRILRFGASPRSYSNGVPYLVRFTPSVGGNLIAYNDASAIDQAFAGSSPPTTLYPFGAALLRTASWPWIVSFLYQGRVAGEVPTAQPGSAGSALDLGDTTGPAQYQTRFYGIGLTAFAAPQTLSQEMESASFSGGFVSAADAGASGGNVAKCPSGTAAGAFAQGPQFVPPPGAFDVYVRMRVTSAASGVVQMRVGLFDQITGWVVGQFTDFAPSAVPIAYGSLIRVATNVTPSQLGGHTSSLLAQLASGVAATTDWWIDEMFLLPRSLTTFRDGPQDLSQQFLFEKTSRYPVV